MLKRLMVAVVDGCRCHARLVALAAVVLVLVLGDYTAANLGMDTNTSKLFPSNLPWRQREDAFDRAFPQNDDLLAIVIDADVPFLADQAASELSARLRGEPALFRNVRQPDGGDFFSRNGLLYLSLPELRKVAAQITQEQPLLGSLSADPTVHGLFQVLGRALKSVADGGIDAAPIARPLEAVTATVRSVLDGHPRPLSWRTLMTGRKPTADELRRFILAQPKLDYDELIPGATASAAVRQAARDLGLTPAHGVRVRLTGEVALDDQQFATVAEGTGLAAVLSLTLVTVLLLLAVRSVRVVLCILATLVTGIVVTGAFAAAAVGSLNLISIAFVVLFVGIAVDFGIQFAVRYRQERFEYDDLAEALRRAAAGVGGSLALAAVATAAGFLSLVPTDYRGVAELGLIAGVGMLVALVLNLTLLPALLAIARPAPERSPAGFTWAAGIDRWLLAHRGKVTLAALAVAVAGVLLAPHWHFDFDPLHLKNQNSESVKTLYELVGSPTATPFTIDVLAKNLGAAKPLAARLEALPEVDKVMSLASFVPDDQQAKLAVLSDLSLLVGPVTVPVLPAHPPGAAKTLPVLKTCREQLLAVPAGSPLHATAQRLAAALAAVMTRYDTLAPALQQALLAGLPPEVKALAEALNARPVTLRTLPATLVRDWRAPDGRARIEVFPKGNARDNAVLTRFTDAVRAVAPEATGSPVSIQESGRTVVHAFVTAGWIALGTLTVLMLVVLRRVRDVALVLAPLLLAGLLTVLVCVAIGLPLNFANIIALPLLLGIGVSFAIYFVLNWRNGMTNPLASATARAVLFSAGTTGAAFGSLALSTDPGTASMGALLAISLACTLLCTLLVLPALLGPPPGGGRGR